MNVIPPPLVPSLQYAYEDSMDLIAKLPTLASAIYCNLYREGKVGAGHYLERTAI